jgi:superoxide oxidase
MSESISPSLSLSANPISSAATQGAAQAGMPEPARDRYDAATRLFHWLFAAGIIYASVVGYLLSSVTDRPLREHLSQLNMSIATVMLVLFPLRALWKLLRTEPSRLTGLPAWQLRVAHAVHGVLYVVMAIALVSGFLMVPHGYSWFGLFWIPTPFAKGPLTADFFVVHRIACALLASLVLMHVMAVAKHQLTGSAKVLRRML